MPLMPCLKSTPRMSCRLAFRSRALISLIFSVAAVVAEAKPISVDLPAQPLADSVHQIAQLSGLDVSVDDALLAGKTAPALKGNLEPVDALKSLLAGSALSVTVKGNKATIASSAKRLGVVQVASQAVGTGTEANGYRVDSVRNLGPWGDMKAIDTPYTTFVLSEEMIKNSFVSNPFMVERVSPLTGLDEFQVSGQGSFVGFRGVGSFNPLTNGIQGNGGLGIFLENVATVETLSGYSGFMYGVGSGGGLENYNLKRATSEPRTDVTVGHYALGGYHGDIDVGRQFHDGLFGIRVNLMGEDGDTVIDHQSSRRRLASVALDFNPLEGLRIWGDAYYGDSRLNGLRGFFSSYNQPTLIPHLDNGGLWAPAGTFSDVETRYFDLGVQYKINDAISVRVAWNHKSSDSKTLSGYGNVIFNGTTATSFTRTPYATAQNPDSDGGYAYLDGTFKTFGIEHRVTAGFNGFSATGRSGVFNYNGAPGTFVRGDMSTFQWNDKAGVESMPVPDFYAGFAGFRKNGKWHTYNFTLGDIVKFNDQWSLMAGLNHSKVGEKDFNALTGDQTGSYSSSATSPTASLMFKPIPTVMTYFTYMQALDQGQIVGETYRNAGEVLPPTKSYEYELGVKVELPHDALLTAALYRLDIASIISSDGTEFGTLTSSGRQVNQGLDLTISGKLLDSLTVTGGYAYIDAKYKKTEDPLTNGTSPWGVPPHILKLTAEYAPPFVKGLAVTGGVYFNGSSPSTTVASYTTYNVRYPGYAEIDLGARYTRAIGDAQATFRLNVANLLDKNQWSYGDLNFPRSVSLSATVAF